MSKVKGEIIGPIEVWTWRCVQCPTWAYGNGSKELAEANLRKHNKENSWWHRRLKKVPKERWTSAPPRFV